MSLTPEQQILCDHIYKSVRDQENIYEIVEKITRDDFLTIFEATNTRTHETILGTFQAVCLDNLKAVLNHAKTLGLLEQIPDVKILSSKDGDEVKSISLIEYITSPNCNVPSDILRVMVESCGLKEFWKVIPEDDRERIKTQLDVDEHQHILGKINQIEEIIRTESQEVKIDNTVDDNPSETSSLASDESTINSKSNSATDTVSQSNPIKPMCKATLDFGNNRELRKNAAKKGMKFGAIGGAITALAVGLGLYFGTGAALTVLPTIIGIALVAALLVGATIGAITYDVLKPKSCIDTVYTTKGFDTVKQETNTATGISV